MFVCLFVCLFDSLFCFQQTTETKLNYTAFVHIIWFQNSTIPHLRTLFGSKTRLYRICAHYLVLKLVGEEGGGGGVCVKCVCGGVVMIIGDAMS